MRFLNRFSGKIAWILTGICFAMMCSLMYGSGTFNLDCFYDVGTVYDIPETMLSEDESGTMHYDAESQIWTVTADTAKKSIMASTGRWRYIYLSLSQVSQGNFPVTIACYGENGELLHQMDTALSEGPNLFHMPKIDYNKFDLILEGQKDLSFCLEKVQLRRKEPVFSKTRFLKSFALSFVGFLCVTSILWFFLKEKIKRISWYVLIEELQSLFLHVGKFGEKFSQKYDAKKRGKIRSAIFCFILLFMECGFLSGLYSRNDTYRYLILVCGILFLLMAFLCWEKPLERQNWNNKLVAAWLGFWALSMVSDFIVEKRYTYTGYIIIFVFGFLFFMWGNMKNREQLIGDLLLGIEWSFWPHLLFCYLFRPYLPGYRYMGTSVGPGYFALYLLFVWIAFLAELDFQIKKKEVLRKDLFCIFALGICADLLWKTQSISSLLPAALAAVVFSYKLWKNRKQVKLLGIACYLLVFGIGCLADSYSVYSIPRMVDAEIKFEKDFYPDTVTDTPFTIVVQAAEEENSNRIWYKLQSSSIEQMTSGRTLYWKAYLREINLWGHRNKAHFLGGTRMAHNGFLSVMYRYGIFAVVPYLMMVVYSLWYACRYFRRYLFERKYAFFVFVNMLIYFLLLFVENAEELPFYWICWYSMYLMMGVYFDENVES